MIELDPFVRAQALTFAAAVLESFVTAPAVGQEPGEEFQDCPDCPVMVVVPAGTFMMGSDPDKLDGEELVWRNETEEPYHEVSIAAPFAVAKFEVTFAEWDACVSASGCARHAEDQGWGRGQRPVINVSWNDAQQYVAWLSAETDESYRLLSEAEWEYAARAGTTTPFSTGSTITTDQANFNGHGMFNGPASGVYREQTMPVGSFPPNPFGLHDMHGNVWEIVEDCWVDSYVTAPTNGSARTAGPCEAYAGRGGAWDSDPGFLRSAFRASGPPDASSYSAGFRVARDLED